jgi:predicted PurR-regulated permease PerM
VVEVVVVGVVVAVVVVVVVVFVVVEDVSELPQDVSTMDNAIKDTGMSNKNLLRFNCGLLLFS